METEIVMETTLETIDTQDNGLIACACHRRQGELSWSLLAEEEHWVGCLDKEPRAQCPPCMDRNHPEWEGRALLCVTGCALPLAASRRPTMRLERRVGMRGNAR